MGRLINLVGQRFGKLVVLERDYNYPIQHNLQNKKAYWKCQCDCGKQKTVQGNNLRNGDVSSCGCKTIRNLSNQKFHKLTALYPTDKRSGESVIWHCKCDCGNECDVSRSNLVYSRILSCGCLTKSTGEENIISILQNNNIAFISEKIFDDFVYEDTKTHPRYDFYLPDFNRLVEYDGEQHYYRTSWDDEIDTLERRQARDKQKTNYALNHNIEIVRIPYWERDNINLDMILGNQYLISYTSKEGC